MQIAERRIIPWGIPRGTSRPWNAPSRPREFLFIRSAAPTFRRQGGTDRNAAKFMRGTRQVFYCRPTVFKLRDSDAAVPAKISTTVGTAPSTPWDVIEFRPRRRP